MFFLCLCGLYPGSLFDLIDLKNAFRSIGDSKLPLGVSERVNDVCMWINQLLA